MKNNDINIRDPFVLYENGKYYMYGTRANNFGKNTGGFDVYISEDLENWSEPIECFDSEKHNLNYHVNWAPEVHKYKDAYYIFATFTIEIKRFYCWGNFYLCFFICSYICKSRKQKNI